MCDFQAVLCADLQIVLCAFFRRWLAARFARVARVARLFVTLTSVRRGSSALQTMCENQLALEAWPT